MNWQAKNIPFTENPGPIGDGAALESEQPVDFTELFISDVLLQNIVDQTNLYADQYIQAMDDTSKHARCHAWKPVTVSEMKTFMGLLFLTGIIHKPELEMYWCTDDMLATPYFNKVMPRNRFEIIWRFLHFNDNTTRPDNCTDRLYKIRPVLDHLVSKFREMYQPKSNICIDEGMFLWRGRLAFRVYNPQKPIKYGVKSYILCDSDTGYCFNMKPYCGESATLGDTVVSLLDRLAGHGYRSFMDNLYNSVRLCERLLDVKTHVCGTIRKNRGEPPVIRDVRNADLRIGETIMRHNKNVMVLAWRDKQTVKMVTTFHQNNMGHVESVIKSWTNQEYASGGEKSATENTPRAPYNTDPKNRLNVSFAVHELVPILPTPKKQHPTRGCRVCVRKGLRKETSFYCKSYGVPLHTGKCYSVYHSKANYSA
ncbi:piggyBac transposable element-derived protein 4-like isoform X2 [Megalobrama amblycephala]|uniref:piggyBac transposable element-derived protein 4-like isoform X2 n=1 Tax=Megalobrama amblycephala TaxID=75352 RepID=UPI0020143424|nr:piggyBac transposable element-derived protein 4-like isoform X2 [Megalobrama amblycephala]